MSRLSQQNGPYILFTKNKYIQTLEEEATKQKVMEDTINNENNKYKSQNRHKNTREVRNEQDVWRERNDQVIVKGQVGPCDVVMFDDSLGKKINDTLLSRENLKTRKILTYTLEETKTELEKIKEAPKAIVYHVGTNNVKKDPPEKITKMINEVVNLAQATKVIISNIVSRDDDHVFQTNLEFINANINMKYIKAPNISTIKHFNIGKINRARDGTHLNTIGTSKLACNIKHAVAKALSIDVIRKPFKDKKDQRYNHSY